VRGVWVAPVSNGVMLGLSSSGARALARSLTSISRKFSGGP